MMSSSIPPAVVTSTLTRLCCTTYRIVSRTPVEIMFDVYDSQIVHLVSARTAGSRSSSSVCSVTGSSLSRQLSYGGSGSGGALG